MIGLAASLIGIGRWLREAATALLGIIVRHPWQAGLIASLVACAGLWWRANRIAEQRDRALATVYRMIEAQKKATAFAVRMKEAFEKANRSLNDETDKSAADVAIVYRDRVLRLPAPRCSTGNPDLPEGGISEGVDGPGAEAVILRTDALICADNQARLESAHAWALKMQALSSKLEGSAPE